MVVTITDENGVAVPSAHIVVRNSAGLIVARGETDFSGRRTIAGVPPGSYSVTVEKPGFYRLTIPKVDFGLTNALDATLNHEQEVRENIDVVESPPAIDPAHTADTETLTTSDLINIPYPTSRDIRNALPLMPTVVRDQSGAIHVGGASITHTLNLLDGFNVGMPTTTFPDIHVSADAVRAIDVDTSRYSAEYGKGTSVLGFETGIGDDKFRYTVTNFIPSLQNRKGINFNQWVPRAMVSGPIRKGKAWFFDSPDAEYDLTIVPELPNNADRSTAWKISNLAKVQVNITPANILSTEFLINNQHANNFGLSRFSPMETTQNVRVDTWVAGIRDQHYFHSGALLETGMAYDNFENSTAPQGNAPYILTPGTTSGSYFEATHGMGRRVQFMLNAFLPPQHWRGRHDVKVGLHVDRLSYDRAFTRDPISMTRTDGTLARRSTFSNDANITTKNLEATAYAQDRWFLTDHFIVESGLRFDWDEIIRDVLLSPRLAATYTLPRTTDTKFSAGLGLFYAATNLDLIGRPQAGTRQDVLYAADGVTPVSSPVVTNFVANTARLLEPRFLVWSLGVEHKFPADIYARADFVQKRGTNEFLYANVIPGETLGTFALTNGRSDLYSAITLSARHTFRQKYPLMLSYTRSSARTNAVFDFSQDTPVAGLQQPGPLPWDTPNRIVGWGWAPAPYFRETTIGYAFEYHTGFPFYVVNSLQQIAGSANAYRFPRYFRPTISVERRFHLAGYYLALRVSAENFIGRHNPEYVDNNVDSHTFLTYGSTDHRTFTARIRLLARPSSHKKTNTGQTQQSPPD